MKTLNEYLAMPYRMEIVEDREEGGFVVPFRSCRAALPAAKRWKPLWRTHRMPKKPGWKQPLRTV